MKFIFLAFLVLNAASVEAKVVKKSVEYRHNETILEGFLAYDDSIKQKLPGVVVMHEWTGINDYIKEKVEQLAKLGYLAFAPDIYGKGIRPSPGKEAAELAGRFKSDRNLMRARALAGLVEIRKQPNVDPSRIAAIGYCFGGTVALELARAGADIAGVASFHGGLSAGSQAAERGKVKAKIVVYHGAEDPNVPPTEVQAFEAEMRKAQADWVLVKYANAVHAFTNHYLIGKNAIPGSAEYNALADQRSWASLQDYLKEWLRN